ncbi:hypothetical protein VNI00_006767 [Paramarasmius palmivorus]|uniref:Uncharacterized protein n=1 Tax=Paramarasmius palmivorus TaxID=297713 RepID=A0AAW0D836_9AGAR
MSAHASAVPAEVFYFVPPTDGSRPTTYLTPRTDGGPETNYGSARHIVQIENVRGKEDTYTLDDSGFQFVKHASNHKGFNDNAEIEKEYYPESIELLKKLTGASKIILFDHSTFGVCAFFRYVTLSKYQSLAIRRRDGEPTLDSQKRGPVPRVHVDQTSQAARNRLRRYLPKEEAEERLKHRFQIINLWRPISHPAFDWPLALVDYRTVNAEEDLVPIDLIYPDSTGQSSGVNYNPDHEWKYLRGMSPEEVILIKCYDSIEDGSVAVFTPHTAFADPTTPEGSPFRESIELRALVFYDD